MPKAIPSFLSRVCEVLFLTISSLVTKERTCYGGMGGMMKFMAGLVMTILWVTAGMILFMGVMVTIQ